MPWGLLLDLRVLLGIALVVVGGYAAVQRLQKEQCRAEFAQFRADVDRIASAAKVKNAQEAARHAQNAQEVLDDLQARHAALNARYSRLRNAPAGGGPVPALSSAAASLSACPGVAGQPDPAIGLLDQIEGRVLAVLAKGDAEIAKLVELWRLQQANAAQAR